MASESPPASSNSLSKPTFRPSLLRLFIEFAKISSVGFGGVLVWTRRSVVEKHGWMTADEFNEAFAISQFLPGPNAINLAVIFGSRLSGFFGGVVVFLALLGPPAIVATIVAILYAGHADAVVLQRVLHGISCAAIGLFASVMVKMLSPLLKRREILPILLMLAVFAGVGLLRWPLAYVLLTAVPASLLLTYVARRNQAKSSG
jgi:chromate transporter